MPSTVNPPPRVGSVGSGRRSSPASCAARSRCAMASDSVASARSLSAAVTRSSGQMPPMSAIAVASATIRLARRIAAATRSRRADGGSAASSAIAAATTASGPEATSARRLPPRAPRDRRGYGLLPPESAQQRGNRRPRRQPGLGAAELGKALDQPFGGARVVRARPSCVGRRNCVSVMRVKGWA